MQTRSKINPGLIFLIILVAGTFAHGINMFRYPYYEADEGTYMSQAWSVANLGRITPYTYLYDHAPGGWILIALWAKLTGGFHTFGFSINSGRALMLVLQVLSTVILYSIAQKLSGKPKAGLIAAFMFMFSPLAIFDHRRVLLDNIMTFWVLLSLLAFSHHKNSGALTILSGAFLGIAILSKETTLAFIPAFILVYLYYKEIKPLIAWIVPLILVVSLYPLYALMRGQLFPNDTGISLFQTFGQQLQRGQGSMLDFAHGYFWESMREWLSMDPLLIIGGLFSVLVSLIMAFRSRYPAVAAFFSIAILAYLGRGGLVFTFYIIPLIPFLALSVDAVINNIPAKASAALSAIWVFVFSLSSIYYSTHIFINENIYSYNQTLAQIQGTQYLKNTAPPGSNNIIENYAYVDLNDGETLRRHFDYYWKAEFDTKTNIEVYGGSYKNVAYVLASPNLYADIKSIPSFKLISAAVSSSTKVQHFEDDGWYVDILKVH